jgi:hypothetical protein
MTKNKRRKKKEIGTAMMIRMRSQMQIEIT